jgi:phage shock protein PspC (stress-responsive transcriptional regulator)
MRPCEGRVIAGVCLGFAEYFDLDVTLIRLIWIIVAIFGGTGFLAYVVAWIVMPSEPERTQIPADAHQVPNP